LNRVLTMQNFLIAMTEIQLIIKFHIEYSMQNRHAYYAEFWQHN